ncbi:MAG: hypothetical protein OIF50_00650 [Flavobacteriaceae bacterium]|nr:hypothetical protein [Flavobacteriaceae bacterium]
MTLASEALETHPLLPSGSWKGFYCYQSDPTQHHMQTVLQFGQQKIFGSGQDDIGSFGWHGLYDLDKMKSSKIKHYKTHLIQYEGNIDENGIWGIWHHPQLKTETQQMHPALEKYASGGFHIWPAASSQEQQQYLEKANKEKSELLEELFIKYF